MSDDDPVLFEAEILPNQSLGAPGLGVVVAVLGTGTLSIGLLFWRLGAWPVPGFCGAEILLVLVLLRRHLRRSRRMSERVHLSREALRITRTDAAGRRAVAVLSPAWLRVQLEAAPGRATRLWVVERARREEIGAVLGEAAKRDLAEALRQALFRCQNPRFDNPQLRDA